MKINFKPIFLILFIALIVRMIPVVFGSDQNADIMLYKKQAYPVLNHLNIYKVTHKVFPYCPISMFLPAACLIISDLFGLPFHITIKLPAILADALIAVSIYLIMLKMKEKNALFWALLYALNPVSILISAFHGNIMPLPALFTLLAYSVLLFGVDKNYRLSALLLGLAIGLRGYPLLLLPLFLVKMQISFKRKIIYLIYCLLPVILAFIPFLILDYGSVIKEVFNYSGGMDYGFGAFMRTLYSLKLNMLIYEPIRPDRASQELFEITKFIFMLVYFVLLSFSRKRKLIDSIVLTFLAFYVIYVGVASQYLIWILPFAFLMRDRFLYLFIIFASGALINFYLTFYPKIIFGIFNVMNFNLHCLLLGRSILLFSLWSICIIWMLSLIRKKQTEKGLLI